jgi:hypothetical protein
MTLAEKQILIDITNFFQNLAVALDSLESVLVHKNLLHSGEIEANKAAHVRIVVGHLAGLRSAIIQLP